MTGRVTKAVAISGHPLLREAALEAARRWEFEPTLAGGVPVETELVLTFNFTTPPPPS
jgi:TonB family protein